MKYEVIKVLEEEKFRRLTGVKRSTFEKMIKILNETDKSKRLETQALSANQVKFFYPDDRAEKWIYGKYCRH